MSELDEQSDERPPVKKDNNLPGWLISLIALVILGLLVYNIIADIRLPDYEGYPVTLLLAGFLGGLVGIRRFMGGDK